MILLALALAICGSGPRVDCVVDGDTIWHRGEKVRLVGFDTPELRARCPAEKRLARQSRDRLAELLGDGAVTLDRDGTDRFGRTLAVVRVDGVDVGAVLVDEGHARVWRGSREAWC